MGIDELLFHHHREELLKSFFDGLDIERNAAEYIISYNNLDNSPNDNVSLLCKDAAQSVLLRKEENENFEADPESIFPQLPGGDASAEFLMGLRSVGTEPTNHPWVDSIQSVEEDGIVHGVFPTPQENIDRHYENIHPFDSKIHPLTEINAVTGNPQMIEMLRGYYLSQEGEEESLSGIDHKDELSYHKSLVEKGSPIVHGIEKTGWKEGEEGSQYSFPFGGNISMPKGIIGTPETLYRRNFNNWKKQNPHHEDKLMSEGVKGKELELELRNIHFNEAVDKWMSDDIKYHDGDAHAVGLGDFAYNHGLEWLEPEERTAVYRHMKDKGSLDEKHQLIELPNGENIPVGFIDNNYDNRGVPEFNWWVRPTSNHGPNIDYKLEDNETDFTTGKNRFIQLGLARAANTSPMFNLTNEEGEVYPATFLDIVKNELLNHPGRNKKGEGEEKDVEDIIENLPRFNLHTRGGKEKGIPEGSYSHHWDDIKEASFKHYIQHEKIYIISQGIILTRRNIYRSIHYTVI